MHSTAYISSVKLSRQKQEQKSAVTVGTVGAFVAFITFLWIYLNIFFDFNQFGHQEFDLIEDH